MHRSYLYPHNLFIFAFLEKGTHFFCSLKIFSRSFQKKTEAKNLGFPKLILQACIPHRNGGL